MYTYSWGYKYVYVKEEYMACMYVRVCIRVCMCECSCVPLSFNMKYFEIGLLFSPFKYIISTFLRSGRCLDVFIKRK